MLNFHYVVVMSKRRKIMVGLVCFAVVAVSVVFLIPDREPQYQGRPLSAWLGDIERTQTGDEQDRARLAIRQIGTNALPELRRRIRFRPTGWRTQLIQWKNKLPASLRNSDLAQRLDYNRSFGRQVIAESILDGMGAAAAPAVPDLEQLVAERGLGGYAPNSFSALMTLTRLGPAAIPALTNLLANFSQEPWYIRASVEGLPGKPQDVRIFIINGLGDLGVHAKSAIPALVETTKSTNAEVAMESVTALDRIRR